MPPIPAVITLGMQDVTWPFGDDGRPVVTVNSKGRGGYGRELALDPFPAYPHDSEVVAATAWSVAHNFPLQFAPTYYVLPLEQPRRTNGGQFDDLDHHAEKLADGRRPLETYITLPAKRIPPHPAMTRYLVVHEYGHAVEANIAYLECSADGDYHAVAKQRLEDYARMRGIAPGIKQAGGTWHAAPQEVYACDFRILVCGVEVEYWPHPGIARPEEVPGLREWWGVAKRMYTAQIAPIGSLKCGKHLTKDRICGAIVSPPAGPRCPSCGIDMATSQGLSGFTDGCPWCGQHEGAHTIGCPNSAWKGVVRA